MKKAANKTVVNIVVLSSGPRTPEGSGNNRPASAGNGMGKSLLVKFCSSVVVSLVMHLVTKYLL
ncbi:hypothetical protein [Herbaspirillum sp. C7C8]|uniref:hypothetical protein n=1 Tax=Herbaspirillum sp. C7C8 TaxID=2736665 RepID=UPI001F5247EB|nr:hypothetical protein [Herbaspirillum sp. C7C8]MCI1006883.1 hypothetical protein [Herbaspirillum sp. C7C8]